MCSAVLKKLFQHSQMKFEDKTLHAGTYRRQIRFSILNENVGPALQTTSMTCMGGLDTNLVQIHYTTKPYQDIINMLKILDPFHLFANTGCGSLVGSVSASQAADPRSSHLVENSFTLPLIQKEQVVRYWRNNGHLMLVSKSLVQATDHPNMISVCYRNTKHNTNVKSSCIYSSYSQQQTIIKISASLEKIFS